MYTRHLRLTLALAVAALLALAPAAMAISGSTGSGQASAAQNAGPGTTPTDSDEGPQSSADDEPAETGEPEGEVAPAAGGGEPEGDVAPAAGGDDAAPTAPAPLAEASAPAAGSLPFTGYLAMSVLLLGAASLLVGVLLRRRTSAV